MTDQILFDSKELARMLQQEENKTLSFEEQDRIVAMEAQDKELARMLQERVSYYNQRHVFFFGVI